MIAGRRNWPLIIRSGQEFRPEAAELHDGTDGGHRLRCGGRFSRTADPNVVMVKERWIARAIFLFIRPLPSLPPSSFLKSLTLPHPHGRARNWESGEAK